jgi:acetylornithine/succinyldiaminopimelate/putrescine aminotransferase
MKTLEICSRPETRSMVHYLAEFLRQGLEQIRADHPDWLVGIRQDGLVIGLEFEHPRGAVHVTKALYDHGVWAIFSTLDPRVLQFKPGLLLTPELAEELLDRVAVGVARARDEVSGPGRSVA